jgi:RNA polymerase sigma-70 factor (ECF subfamily)
MNGLSNTPNDPMDIDIQLVRAVQAGDMTAFDGLVHRHKDRLFNLVYRFLGDYQEADECAQEIFIKVFKSIKTFRFESTFSTWLFRIAVNTCKNRIKSSGYRWKKRTVSIENPEGPNSGNPFLEFANNAPTPMATLEKKERWMRIQKAVNALPEEQNRVVVLRDIQGLSYQEISDITGLNLGTVKSKLARARLALRDMLKSVINKSI